MSITDVAMESGFDNVTYFEKIFRDHTGYSPLKYRKLFGKSTSER